MSRPSKWETLAFAKTLPRIIVPDSTVPFSSGFEEAKTCAMKLAKTDLQVLEIFYDCLYTQNIWDKYAEWKAWPIVRTLVKLYAFADNARVPSWQNQALTSTHGMLNIGRKLLIKET
jgi:hypothetical protein